MVPIGVGISHNTSMAVVPASLIVASSQADTMGNQLFLVTSEETITGHMFISNFAK